MSVRHLYSGTLQKGLFCNRLSDPAFRGRTVPPPYGFIKCQSTEGSLIGKGKGVPLQV